MARSVTAKLYFEIDGQLHEIKSQLRQEGGYPYDPHHLKTALHALIEGKFESTDHVFFVRIENNRSVEEMVKAGKYDWTHRDVTSEHFRQEQGSATKVAIHMVKFKRAMQSDEVMWEFDRQGLRPATLREILALGEQYPQLQQQFSIVALGSVWLGQDGHQNVLYLFGSSHGRGLSLDWFESEWNSDFRFAAIRKEPPKVLRS